MYNSAGIFKGMSYVKLSVGASRRRQYNSAKLSSDLWGQEWRTIRHGGAERSHESLPPTRRPIPSFRCSSRSHINVGSWLRHGHRHRAARIACPKQSKLYLSSRVRPRVDTSVFERADILKGGNARPSVLQVPAQLDNAVTSVATSRQT